MVTASGGRRYRGLAPEERRAARRRRLLDAGLELFGRQGYASTSIEELCATARVTARHFYEEFAGRERLLAAVADEAIEQALNSVRDAVESSPADPAARATAGVGAFVRSMLEDPRRARVCLVESVGVSPELEARRRQLMLMFAELIREQGELLAGTGAIPSRDFSLTALAVVGAANELMVHWLGSPHPPAPDQIVREISRMLIAMATAPD